MLASSFNIIYNNFRYQTRGCFVPGGILTHKRKNLKFIIIFLLFIVYFFIAARPIPRETVLSLRWISSLAGSAPEANFNVSESFIPFTLGNRFGYVDSTGQFALNRIMTNDIYLGQNMWTEYGAEPANIVINNINTNNEIIIANARGYPLLLDNRIFILGSEQNSLSEFDHNGNIIWTYEFGAPLTSIDVRAGLVLTGSLDGAIEVFNSSGERIFYFEPAGSRYSVILGCSISHNGSRIAVISGIDRQRFLLFERTGNTGGDYKIIYHEFLETGFRRPVRVLFINDDQRVVFEREGGIGLYNIRSRRGMFIPLDGEIAAIDELGDQGFLFLIISQRQSMADMMSDIDMDEDLSGNKYLIGIRFPPDRLFRFSRYANRDAVFLRAPFRSDDVFLDRNRIENTEGRSSVLVAGGGTTLISFDLEEK
jgi:hypothetical protein